MTQLRLIQNFGGMRAIVAGSATPPLQAGLERLGLHVEFLSETAPSPPVFDPERDVLLLDGDAGLPAPLLARAGEQALPVPVLGMVGIETPGRMRLLMRAGATAFLRKPVQGGALYAALFLGINTFRERRAAEARLAEHERRRRGRRHVIKAVLQVMQRHGLDDEAAYERLRRAAMRTRAGIEDFCEAWLQEPERSCSMEQEREHG